MVNLKIFLKYSDNLNFNNLKPCGISNFTAFTASDAVTHTTIAKQHFPPQAGFRYAQLAYLRQT
jgi:hypothetical protein